MAKFYNNRVKTGRLAGSVFAVRFGETIERAYQPVVANPNSPAQIESRAKLKALSQLAAVMAPVIAIPREGAVSSRNRFTQENYSKATYSSSQASINLLQVSLTKSVLGLPNLMVSREGGAVSVSLAYAMPEGVSRVVYAIFVKQDDKSIRYLSSSVVSNPGETSIFPTTVVLDSPSLDVIIYAYGIRDNTDAARVTFGNLEVPTATNIAQLIVSRALTNTDVTLTETRAIESTPGE